MRRALLVVGWLWALPTSLVGLLAALLLGAVPYRLRPAGVWQWVGVRWFWGWFFGQGWGAITFGCVTIFGPDLKDSGTMIRHERQHTIQALALGPFFLPLYLLMAAMEWAAGRADPYRADPLEVDAYAEQERPDGFG